MRQGSASAIQLAEFPLQFFGNFFSFCVLCLTVFLFLYTFILCLQWVFCKKGRIARKAEKESVCIVVVVAKILLTHSYGAIGSVGLS